MQMTIYYTEADQYLIDKIEQEAAMQRKSKSAVILTALERYFGQGRKIGEILCDMGCLNPEDLKRSLEVQQRQSGRLLGEILLEQKLIGESDLYRALAIQGKAN